MKVEKKRHMRVFVDGMTTTEVANRITSVISEIPGVESISAEPRFRTITIFGKETEAAQVKASIIHEGLEVVSIVRY